MKTRVSVNGHKLRANRKDGRRRRIFRIEQGGLVRYANLVQFTGPVWLVYVPKKPLHCGAVAYLETESQVYY